MALYDWQAPWADAAVRSLTKNRVFVLAACTGAGKTPVACETMARMRRPAMVIVPKVSITQWNRWIDRTPGCREHVVLVTNPEQLNRKSGFPYYDRVVRWHGVPDDLLVVWDEVHHGCSGVESRLTEACAWLKRLPKSSLLALSATVADNPLKLRALGFWMGFWPHFTVLNEFYAWCRAHGCGRRPQRVRGRTQWVFDFTKSKREGARWMAQIRSEMGERFLSVTPEEIPGFPDQVLDVVRVDLDARDRREVDEVYSKFPPNIARLSEDELVALGQLQQRAELLKARALAELVVRDVSDGMSVVVMVNYRNTVAELASLLDAEGVRHVEILGQMKDAERQANIDAFQANEVHVCLATLKAAGVSLSLHDERHERRRASYISPGYDASDVIQALGRIRRTGGTTAFQHFVFTANTVEERVADAVERKLGNIEALNRGDLTEGL